MDGLDGMLEFLMNRYKLLIVELWFNNEFALTVPYTTIYCFTRAWAILIGYGGSVEGWVLFG